MKVGVSCDSRFVSLALRRWIFSAALLLAWPLAQAADMRPVVGPGATKDDVINAYGWPTGQSRAGTKEILNYPQGSVTLADGKVERVDFSPNVPWPAPRPRPAAPTATTAKRPAPTADPWLTSVVDAAKEAKDRHVRILAAFVGSDWSPPSKRFLDEVATHPDFINAFAYDFVLLKLDFPTRAAQTPELKKQNEELRARCGVTTYPSLIVISPQGDPIAVADLARDRTADTFRAKVIAAVLEVSDVLKQKPVPVEDVKANAVPPSPATSAATDAKPVRDGGERGLVEAVVSSAGWALLLGLGGGSVLAGFFVWRLWRSRMADGARVRVQPKFSGNGSRVSDVPSAIELQAWPAERVRLLVAAMFEAAGYEAHVRSGGIDADVELRRAGHAKPSVLVSCRPGSAGPVGAKVVRELFGSLVSESVTEGWIVALGGFSEDAQAIATERGIELIDADGVIERLRALDPMRLTRVLGRASA